MNPLMLVAIEVMTIGEPESRAELIKIIEAGYADAENELAIRDDEMARISRRLSRVNSIRSPYKNTLQNPRRPTFIARKRALLIRLDSMKADVWRRQRLLSAASLLLRAK